MQLGFVYKKTSDRKLLTLPLSYYLIRYADGNFANNPKDPKLFLKN